MRTKFFQLIIVFLWLATFGSRLSTAFAQGTAFTYQGRLQNNGIPANGLYDFQFSLSNAPGGGSQVGGTVTNLAIGVTNGLFITRLDFGSVFTGQVVWLAIGVRSNGVGGYFGLTPLQPVTPTPYAIWANSAINVSGPILAGQLSGTVSLAQLPGSVVTNLATPFLNGSVSSNTVLSLLTVADQQAVQLLPPIVFFDGTDNQDEVGYWGVTNQIALWNSSGVYQMLAKYGKPWVFFDYGWQATNNMRDANGNLMINIGRWADGSGVFNYCHSNGYNVEVWLQDGSTTYNGDGISGSAGGESPTYFANIQQDITFIQTNWGVNGVWYDTLNTNMASEDMLAITVAGDNFLTEGNVPARSAQQAAAMLPHMMSIETAVRLNYNGDPVTFGLLMQYWDDVQTYGWQRFVRPGHFFNMQQINFGNWQRSSAENHSDIIYHAMMSSVFDIGVAMPSVYPILNNPAFWAVAEDPAVIGATRVLQTNNFDVYLKPLGSATGPNYALSILLRGTSSAATNLTLPFSSMTTLPNQPNGWTVTDVEAGTSVAGAAGVSVSLTNHDSRLFTLSPPASPSSVLIKGGIVLPQLAIANSSIALNAMAAMGSATATNWTLLTWTNGQAYLVATNHAGGWLWNKLTGTPTATP